MRDEQGHVSAQALVVYLHQLGLSEELVSETLRNIDVNQDNTLTWAEYGTKISMINQLRKPEPKLSQYRKVDTEAKGSSLRKSVHTPKFCIDRTPSFTTGDDSIVEDSEQTVAKKINILLEAENSIFAIDEDLNDDVTVQMAEQRLRNELYEEDEKEEKKEEEEREEEEEEEEVEITVGLEDSGEIPSLDYSDKIYKIFGSGKAKSKPKHLWRPVTYQECVQKPADFILSVLENNNNCLATKGYTVVELPQEVAQLYARHVAVFTSFIQSQAPCSQQFVHKPHVATRHHSGFATPARGQLAMRLCGKATHITTPSNPSNDQKGGDLGVLGMTLYEHMDQICRRLVSGCAKKLGIPPVKLDILLDPINQIGQPVVRDLYTPEICYSSYVPDGYLSSSILESYYNTAYKGGSKESDYDGIFAGTHTDGGVITAAIVSDVPGLEVYDQELQQWISIEQLVHEHAHKVSIFHTRFAIVYWGRAVSYLKGPPGFQPCSHRVRKGSKERYSVEFKQRSTPLTTPCRGKEDQALMEAQLNAVKHVSWDPEKRPEEWYQKFIPKNPLLFGTTVAISAIIGALVSKYKLRF